MTATLTGIMLADAPASPQEAVGLIQATIDAVCTHSAFTREQFVLEGSDASGLDDDLVAFPVTDLTLAEALSQGEPVDLHVMIETPEDIVLPLMLECDPFGEQPRIDVAADDIGLDARGLLLALVELWGARLGYFTDDDLMEAGADYVVPIGQLTWLDEELHLALALSDVPRSEEVAGGWLFTLPHGIGDPAAADDVRAIVEASDE